MITFPNKNKLHTIAKHSANEEMFTCHYNFINTLMFILSSTLNRKNIIFVTANLEDKN